MIHEAGWRYLVYYFVLGTASLGMLVSVLRSSMRAHQALKAELEVADNAAGADPGVKHDPVLTLVMQEERKLQRKTLALSLLWGTVSLANFGLSIPAFAAAYHLHQANILNRAQEYTDASREYQRALKLNRIASEINTGYDRAVTHQDLHIDTILTNAEQKVRTGPVEAAAHNDLADVLMAHQEIDRAIQEYRRALALRPGYAMVHNNLGLALQLRHQMLTAQAEFQQAIALEPVNPAFHYNLARAYVEARDTTSALAEYRKSLTLRPDFLPSYLALAVVFQQTGKHAEAEKTLRQMLWEMQGDPNARPLAAQVQNTLHEWQSGRISAPVPRFDTAP